MGRRVRKEVYEGSTKTAEKVYVYDRWNVIQELDMTGETPSVVRAYVWGLDVSGSLQGAGGVGGLLAVDDGASVCYATYDANGNVSEYLNSATGATAAHYEYDGFGNLTAVTGSANAFPHRFSTKYTDDESGLVYYGYRYYSPELGRWVNRDPIGEEGGCNLFSAKFNNPVNNLDYLGFAVSVGSIDLDSILRALRSRPRDQRPTNECIRRIVELWRQHLIDQDSRLRGGNEGTDLLRRIYAELASNPNVQVVVQLGVIGDRGAASVRDYRDGRSRTILITLDMQLPDKCCEYPRSVVKQWNNIGVTFAHEMVHAYAAVLHRGHIQDRHTARQLQQRVSRWGNIEQDLLDDVRIPITEARRRFGAYIPDQAVIWFNHPVGGDMTSVMRALGYMLWGRYDEELSPVLAPFIRNGENNQ
jgi:RHS repeat-associated protein